MSNTPSLAGPKTAWIGGFIGVPIWIPLLAAVFFSKGDTLGGIGGLALYAANLAAMWLLRPWAHPKTPFARLYLPALAPMLLATAFFIWRHTRTTPLPLQDLFTILAILFPIFLPALLHGAKTWEQDTAPRPGP